jgi:hypothetical protein
MLKLLISYAERYSAAKRQLGESLGVSDNLLHVHVGLAIFVVTALLIRRRMRSPWPLAVVALFAVLNEAVDYLIPRTSDFSIFDVLNTIFWPTVLFLLARRGGGINEKVIDARRNVTPRGGGRR